jgi:hypothetical protein
MQINRTQSIERILNKTERQYEWRNRLVDRAIVELDGKFYKANEKAQQRMERTLEYLTRQGQKTVEWITAEGKISRITVAKLQKIYDACLENQYQIFIKAQKKKIKQTDVDRVEEAYTTATRENSSKVSGLTI